MRRGLILFVGILVLALAPAMVCAQYSGAFGLSGLPSMPSFFGGSSKCGDACAPNLAPVFYVGWGIPSDGNTSVRMSAQNNGISTLRNISLRLPTNGLWLGTALPVSLGDNLSFVATGWYLFSGQTNADFNDDFNPPPPANPGSYHSWGTQGAWWFVDGAVAYGWTGFAALVGLRYDNQTLKLSSPSNNTGLFTGQQEGDFLSSAWIPFIGFQSSYTDSLQSLKIRMLGIPTIVGYSNVGFTITGADRLQYNNVNYSSGYFFEAFGEYTRRFFGSSQAGVFLRWNSTKALSSDTASLVTAGTKDTFDFSLNRNAWTLGGLVTLDFNTPF